MLFFANKNDLSGAMSASDISDSLELQNIVDRPWHI